MTATEIKSGWAKEFTFQYGYIQMERVEIIPCSNTIYIPIWLYSNQSAMYSWETHTSTFTFQYGYIQIIVGSSQIPSLIEFTFQYGYIQICSIDYQNSQYIYLHSNMVIFKSFASVKLIKNPFAFTFQYGYIQILFYIVSQTR